MDIIKVENLTKKFDDFIAVDGISFNVEKGQIFGFLGPNGAGKSTTISMLSTLLRPSSGRAFVNDFNILTQRDAVRKSIGMVFQDPSLDDRLSAMQNLRFHAKLYGIPANEFVKRAKEVLDLVELWDRRDQSVINFSGGMKRRLEIARGLMHYPSVLFLDEPTIGLDPQTRVHLWDYILKLKKEKQMTIFMTTHYMNEAEYCDWIAIIDHGKIVALDSPDNLKKSVGGDIITIKTPDKRAFKRELQPLGKMKVSEGQDGVKIEVANGGDFLPRLLQTVKTPVENVEFRKPTLDDVFLQMTGRSIREEEASNTDRLRQRMKVRRRH